jgi:hypothetical protein
MFDCRRVSGSPFTSLFLGGFVGFTLPPALSGTHGDTEDGTGPGPDGRVEGTHRVADGAAWGDTSCSSRKAPKFVVIISNSRNDTVYLIQETHGNTNPMVGADEPSFEPQRRSLASCWRR